MTTQDPTPAPATVPDALRAALGYPLYDALVNRRSRRFPLGATLGGLTPFESPGDPVPLSQAEEALLVFAGTGRTGLNLADMHFMDESGRSTRANTMLQFESRTYPSACGAHATELFYTNDEGVFASPLRDAGGDAVIEFTGADEAEQIVREYGRTGPRTVQLRDERLDLPMEEPIVVEFNQWNANQPGSTLFMPVTDVTQEYINLLITYMTGGTYFYDDLNGNAEPLRRYADSGLLSAATPMALSDFERRVCLLTTGPEQAFMCQNMFLAVQALGLGGWIFSASPGPVVMGGTPLMEGLGFRFHDVHVQGPRRPLGGAPARVPVGIDGVFTSFTPPYFGSMADAVQAVIDGKWGAGGIFCGAATAVDAGQVDVTKVPRTERWAVDAAKDLCEYIWATYGRFPATIDPMQMNIWFQAHHLETGFYDRYYRPGAYHQAIRDHMTEWHR